MANAADYLIITKNGEQITQVVSSYKLRSRATNVITFRATNAAPNYTLTVTALPEVDGVYVDPPTFNLAPNQSILIEVSFDTSYLETLSSGIVEGLIDFTVSATPTVIPQIPQAPVPPPLPEAPRQIVSRVQIVPSSYIFSVLGAPRQFQAVLYVDDVPVTDNVRFSWEMEENVGQGFSVNENGVIRALRPGIFTGIVSATVIHPVQYSNTKGLSTVTSNIPELVSVDEATAGIAAAPTTGTINVNVSGLPTNAPANITITGRNNPIIQTTSLDNLPPGNYTVTPNVVTIGGEEYIAVGGGVVNLQAGETKNFDIKYELQPTVIDDTQLVIIDILGPKGTLRGNQAGRAFFGETISVIAETRKAGVPTNLGTISFTASKTTTGTQNISPTNGRAQAIFRIVGEGVINITVTAANKTVTEQITAVNRSRYQIRTNAPTQILPGQCTAITATVVDTVTNTVLENIAVAISVTGATVSDTPCGTVEVVEQQAVVFGGGGGGGGSTITNTGTLGVGGGGVSVVREFDQTTMIDSGINAI